MRCAAKLLVPCHLAALLVAGCTCSKPLPEVGEAGAPSPSASSSQQAASTRGSSPLLAPVSFGPPHVAKPSAARLDAALRAKLNGVDVSEVSNVDDLIAAALRETGRRLHFGMRHSTRLRFGVEEREAHCVEYSHLFAAVVELLGGRTGLTVKAYVVRSGKARVLGQKLPFRGFGDHDWVLVVQRAGGRRWFVDPSLADAGLGWNIESRVSGQPGLPSR